MAGRGFASVGLDVHSSVTSVVSTQRSNWCMASIWLIWLAWLADFGLRLIGQMRFDVNAFMWSLCGQFPWVSSGKYVPRVALLGSVFLVLPLGVGCGVWVCPWCMYCIPLSDGLVVLAAYPLLTALFKLSKCRRYNLFGFTFTMGFYLFYPSIYLQLWLVCFWILLRKFPAFLGLSEFTLLCSNDYSAFDLRKLVVTSRLNEWLWFNYKSNLVYSAWRNLIYVWSVLRFEWKRTAKCSTHVYEHIFLEKCHFV